MAYENIKLPLASFTIKDGTFFFFDHINNLLYQKNTKGDVIFTYSSDVYIGSEILSTHFDGINFWTLQEGEITLDRIVKKWRIEDYTCVLKSTYYLDSTTTDYNYDIAAFAVESFSSTLSSGISIGGSTVSLSSFSGQVLSGTVLTIGPNSDNLYEEVTVTGTIDSNTYGLDFFTKYNHLLGESVSFTNNLWFFNNYDHKILQGTLCRFNINNKEFTYSYTDNDLINIDASTFYIDGNTNYVTFVLSSTLRFFDITILEVTKTLFMDNIRSDEITITPVKEIEIENGTLYRLQNYMTYYGVDYNQTTYNYQCSPIRSFVDSVSMDVYPKVLPSNGMSIANILAAVQDQYGQPAKLKVVRFFDDEDEYGFITIAEPLTDNTGLAKSYYKSGTSPNSVVITAFITQYD